MELDEITEVFAPAKQSLESGLDEKRELRDELNAKVRAYLDTRNEAKIDRSKSLFPKWAHRKRFVMKPIPESISKFERAVKSDELKSIRTELREILSRLKIAERRLREILDLLLLKFGRRWMPLRGNTKEGASQVLVRRVSLEK